MPSTTTGLNIKNREVLRLAEEVAQLAGETKTEAIRKALLDRKRNLGGDMRNRTERLDNWLKSFWASMPPDIDRSPVTKEEEADILGYGPGGV